MMAMALFADYCVTIPIAIAWGIVLLLLLRSYGILVINKVVPAYQMQGHLILGLALKGEVVAAWAFSGQALYKGGSLWI